jgi:predicted neutral ceramidase superfamily lipid hydrolase
MKKTALAKHIDFTDGVIAKIDDIHIRTGLILMRDNATELLEEERQNLIDACNHNKGVNGWTDGEEYFNNTFEQ